LYEVLPVLSRIAAADGIQERIATRIRTLRALPTTVAVAVRIFELQKDPTAEVSDYTRIIASDAGITARLLALANSSWVGVSKRITQVNMAVSLLGVAAVRTLALNLCLSGLHHELRFSRQESQEFWEVSLCKAVAAREAARRLDAKYAEDAYVGGLFQDLALPIMYSCARQAMGPLLSERINTTTRLAREREVCGADHCEFGEILARRLGLCEAQVQLVEAHHDWNTLQGTVESPALAAGTYVASLFPHRLNHWHADDVEALRAFLASPAGGGVKLEEFLEVVGAECKRQFAYFDPSRVTEIKLLELMGEAVVAAAETSVELVGRVRDLEQQIATTDKTVSKLVEAASRDPLTGILNRAAFERECQEALIRMERAMLPVALLYLDVDRFKNINDIHGHAAGDKALKDLVKVVQECIRGTDLVGRLGGDEFAVLLPNCPRERAADIAERIRARVAQQRAGQGHLSVSIGAQCVAGGRVTTLETLMSASDQGMYAAKRDGGNLVSVRGQ
jgi:diguanylate cyclase (GGDEF)-like protein